MTSTAYSVAEVLERLGKRITWHRGQGLALLLALVVGAPAAAQTIRVASRTVVAAETDPYRFAEPHLAIHPNDPKHLLGAAFVAWAQEPRSESRQRQRCAAFLSRDGGVRWQRHEFALVNCQDPQVAILPDGQAVFVALAELPGVQPRDQRWLIVFHSADAGVTWDAEPTVIGRDHDHPAIVVDQKSPARKGWIYVTTHLTWRDGNASLVSGVFTARSRNGGKSFDTPSIVSPNQMHNLGEMPAVLSDGTVVASFVDDVMTPPYLERRRAWVIRSTDGASTYSTPFFVDDSCGPPPVFQLSALVADTSDGPLRDRLYFACRASAGGPIVVTASGDRGETWSRPGVAVGPSGIDGDAKRVVTMAVNNRGVLGAVVIERLAARTEHCLRATFAASFDGGASFTAPEGVSSSACVETPAEEIARRRLSTYGDYFGLVAAPDGRFHMMWPEMSDGRSVLMTAVIQADGPIVVPAPKKP